MSPHQANLIDYTNKAIIEETPLYVLFGPQWDTTPGFFIFEPKIAGSKKAWIAKVLDHLRIFSDPYNYADFKTSETTRNQITYQNNQRLSFLYQNGFVAVYPEKRLIEISQSHPNKDNVIQSLLKIRTLVSASNKNRIASPKVNITFSNG